ncbi:TrfB-related DNA-binding protein [Pseudomonas fluorescens]|uniref:TrfB-related DNA-binding protein n=1 Tax=Pseudomonas fluorescens TaxID=294 RepID=UPI0012401509|nr:TrfB-related DNA-binding protein [Pseudomonas fluorescens]
MKRFERISADEFESYLPILERFFTAASIKLARLVLVDGKNNADAARIVGTSRQNVGKTVARVMARVSGYPGNWVRVDNVWAPPDVAAAFKAEVRAALERVSQEAVDNGEAR